MKSGIRSGMLALLALVATAGTAHADWGAINLPVGVTPISREQYELHMIVFWICVAIGVVVFGAMFYSIARHRKAAGRTPSTWHESTRVEVFWTVVPMLILVAMAVPAARTLIMMEDFSDAEMSVQVTGYQWRWHYEYLDEDIEFYSQLHPEHNRARQLGSDLDPSEFEHYLKDVDNPLVLPVDTKIRFLHTAGDVIHSWWVQDFGLKKDAIPGFINENWAIIEEPGTYRGKCAELCGRDHGFMPIVVEAVTKEEFREWVAEQGQTQQAAVSVTGDAVAGLADGAIGLAKPAGGDASPDWPMDRLMAHGQTVYEVNCMGCHQREGQGIPNLFPAIGGSEIVTGSLDAHASAVLDGIDGTAMSAFSERLDDADVAAVLTYQRNAFGNDTGDVVQPDTVRELRHGSRQSALAVPESDSRGVN